MKREIISLLSIACIVPFCNININAKNFAENPVSDPYSAGLINTYDLYIFVSDNNINLCASTSCNHTMKSAGIKSIEIQRSADGISWTTVTSIDDIISENTLTFSDNISIGTGISGYFYRAVCTHYAEEKGFFGNSESIADTSNSVYIQ